MKKILTIISLMTVAIPAFSSEFKTTYLGIDSDGVKSYVDHLAFDDGPKDGRGAGDLIFDFPTPVQGYSSKSISIYVNCDKSNERFNKVQQHLTRYLDGAMGNGKVLSIEGAPNSDWVSIGQNPMMIRFRDAVCEDQKHSKPHESMLYRFNVEK